MVMSCLPNIILCLLLNGRLLVYRLSLMEMPGGQGLGLISKLKFGSLSPERVKYEIYKHSVFPQELQMP